VIDGSNLVQSIMTVIQEIMQIENQISQIQGQADQLASMSNGRGLGNSMRSSAFENYLPPNLTATYDSLKGGYSSLTGLAKTLRDSSMLYNCADRTGAAQRECQESLARPYQQLADTKSALQKSNARLAQINSLMDRASSSADQKEIAELQARIGGENALLLQEMSRVQMTESLFQAQDRADKARQEERRLERLNRTGTLVGEVVL
jgi:type IV secretion system protein VirB5